MSGKYIPPPKRGLVEASDNKFKNFLMSRPAAKNKVKAQTPWGNRDRRNGYLDQVIFDKTENLYQKVSSEPVDFGVFEDVPIEVSENTPYMESFEVCDVNSVLLENVKKMGYSTPTPIQKYAIPVSLIRRNLMACAQTGSGKTAAFLFPMLAKMLNDGPPPSTGVKTAHPVGLVLAPTRELSIQIYEEALKFAHTTGIRVVVVYGGADPRSQAQELSRGADIIVATPGRLIDFMNRGRLNLGLIRYLVLDEADRMLDMGFEPQIQTILKEIPESRETVMCSATFPQSIQSLASEFLKDYVFLSIGRVGSTSENITQEIHYVDEGEKKNFISRLLQGVKELVVIFVETKRTADFLEEFLRGCGYSVTCIHGDRTQPEREKAFKEFKSKQKPIMVATDVASRGLDIPNVGYVINYDLPNNIEDYVHRIGRTGRIGKEGVAIALMNDKNKPILKDLYSMFCETNQAIPDWFEEMYRSNVIHARRGRGRRPYRSNRHYF